MKIFIPVSFILFLAFTIGACHSDGKKEKEDALVAAQQRMMHEADSAVAARTPKGQNVGSPLDNFVSNFITSRPSMMNNEHTRDLAAKKFTGRFSEWLKGGQMSGQKFHLWSVSKDGKADLTYYMVGRESTYAMTLSVSAQVSPSDMNQLVEGSEYVMEGSFYLRKEPDGTVWNCGLVDGPKTISRQVVYGTIFSALNVVCVPARFTLVSDGSAK